MISRTAERVRRQIAKVDNPEVRKGRRLVRQARTGKLDVLLLGDSVTSFTASYDTDRRQLHHMLRDMLGADVTMHAVHGGSHNPLIHDQYVRLLEGQPARPVVVLPLTVRVRTLPWIEHPLYGHRRASGFLATVAPSAPLRTIRKGFEPPSAEEFDRFYSLPFPTWEGDLKIGDYVHPIKRGELDRERTVRRLYAYHHGGEVVHGAPLEMVRQLGQRLRDLDLPLVAYQTPVPVQKGVELYGPEFRELATRNFELLEAELVSGYGDVKVLQTGLTVPTEHFIDWRDGSEHVNDRGRATIAAAVVEAVKAAR